MVRKLDQTPPQVSEIRNYFVDEAGDGVLFAGNGRMIVDTPGCSRFFILGLLDVPNPGALSKAFQDLRTRLLLDPYFKGVPSMQPGAGKTALAFHAKDDLPEVRKEVFTILSQTEGLRFFAVVDDKLRVLEYVRQQNERKPNYRYHPNELYDYLVKRLFKNRLHTDSGYQIIFSQRGKSDRTEALLRAIETARQRSAQQGNATIQVEASAPQKEAGLQAVDYFNWALQRLYTRGEDRYLEYLWPAVRLIQDISDMRQNEYGVYYTQKKPLTAAALVWREQNKKPGI
jgi:hypothetical protein